VVRGSGVCALVYRAGARKGVPGSGQGEQMASCPLTGSLMSSKQLSRAAIGSKMQCFVIPRSASGPLNLSRAVGMLNRFGVYYQSDELCDTRASRVFRMADRDFAFATPLFAAAGIEYYIR
jgi:hypothetical protein